MKYWFLWISWVSLLLSLDFQVLHLSYTGRSDLLLFLLFVFMLYVQYKKQRLKAKIYFGHTVGAMGAFFPVTFKTADAYLFKRRSYHIFTHPKYVAHYHNHEKRAYWRILKLWFTFIFKILIFKYNLEELWKHGDKDTYFLFINPVFSYHSHEVES